MAYEFVIGGHYYCQPEWRWQVRSLPDYDLWLVLNGTGRLESKGDVYTLGSGDCFVFAPDCVVLARHDPSHPLEVIAIHFLPLPKGAVIPFPLHRKLNDTKLLVELMQKALFHDHVGDCEKATFWLTAALTQLEEADHQASELCPLGPYDETIHTLADEIESSPGFSWTIGQMARQCNLSNDHFTKVFKAVKGVPPMEFLIQSRITVAKHELLHSSFNVSQIAEKLGYSSVYFFSRQFKAKVGSSPRDYRRSFLG